MLDRHSPRWRLQDSERKALAEEGKPLNKLLNEEITIVQPETMLKWHRRLVASKWNFSSRRDAKPGRPPIAVEVEKLVVQLVRENPGWGNDRMVGALNNMGDRVSDRTIGNILKRNSSSARFGMP